jgi:hypothetical protein
MKDSELILSVLRSIERRLWLRRALQEIACGACVVLFSLIAFQFVGAALSSAVPAVGTGARAAVVAAVVMLGAYVAWRALRQVTLAQAAGEVDARARLKDELKSAYWFVSTREPSPFAELQIARAAATARRLDPGAIISGGPPRSLYAVAGLSAALLLITWIAPRQSDSWDGAGAAAMAAARETHDLRMLLEGAPRDPEIEKLDRALEELQRADASAEEKARAAAQARDAIEQANMEAAAAREGIVRLAEAMRANPRFEKAAEALRAGRNEEALALLRQMRAETGDQDARTPQKDEPRLLSDTEKDLDRGIEERLAQGGRELSSINARVDENALDRVVNALQEVNQQLEVQRRVTEVKRRMQDAMIPTSQRSALTASQFDSSDNAPNATASPDTGNADIRGGTMFRQGAVTRRNDDEPARDGNMSGSAAGNSEALALEGAATRRLDAQLKLEAIQRRDNGDNDDQKADQGWFYSASQEQKSLLGFEDARARPHFDRENAMTFESVPIRQKQAVKNYFLNLHESEKK